MSLTRPILDHEWIRRFRSFSRPERRASRGRASVLGANLREHEVDLVVEVRDSLDQAVEACEEQARSGAEEGHPAARTPQL